MIGVAPGSDPLVAHPARSRPVCASQARATLEFTLQQQIDRKRAALDALRQTVAGVRERVGAAAAALAAAGGDAAESAPNAAAAAAAGAAAAAMDTS